MRWIFTPILLISFVATAQDGINFGDIATESSESLDNFGYYDPVFKWDMEGRVQAALNDGINYLSEGNPNLALPQLDESIKLAPNLWVAHYYRGVCLKKLQKYPEAEQEFLKVNELNDKNVYNYIELAKTYDLMGDYSKGERWFERAGKIDPDNVAPVYMLANHCVKAGFVDRAKRLYKDCIQMDSRMFDAEVKLAILDFTLTRNPKKALKYLEDVLAKDSLHKQALIFHGILKIDDTNASLRDWNRLVRLSPGNTNFRFVRGMLLTNAGNYDVAFSDLRKVVDEAQLNSNRFRGQQSKLDQRIDIEFAGYYVVSNVYGFPDDDATRLKKAYCLLFPGKFDEALAAIKLVRGASKSPLCLFLKGIANEHKGSHNTAFYAYDSALMYDNDIIDAHKKRGIYLMELKEWNLAEKDFTEMLRINPEAYVAYRFRGLAKMNNKKFKDALPDYNNYLERDSSNNEVRAERAMAYQRLGYFLPSTLDLLKSRNFQALESFKTMERELNRILESKDTAQVFWWLRQFTTYKPNYTDAHKMVVKLLIAQNKWDDVVRYIERTITADQNGDGSNLYTKLEHAWLFTTKGIALNHVNKQDEAIQAFGTALGYEENYVKAYSGRADVYLKMKNVEGAKKDLAKAKKLGDLDAAKLLESIH
ncbi:MAG: tetratricopeptide repeat protein [Bacteroidota bacterium]